jgi:hypothetical protein
VGLRDIITGRHELKTPAPDRLFAVTTAYVTLQSAHDVDPTGVAAIVFQALATSDFDETLKDMEEVVKAAGQDSATSVSTQDDSYGYRWMILRSPENAPSVEDLAVGINAVAGSIETAGYGERLLCAVFAFSDQHAAAQAQRIYLIYNYKRGYWYPFVPTAGGGEADKQQRATERELQLKAQIGAEMPIDPELERWFPLWGIPI